MAEYSLILILISLAWLWMDSISKREVAIRHGRDIALRFQLQLLDEAVACTQWRVARDGRGHLRFKRCYSFEVATSDEHRFTCQLTLLGEHLIGWDIPPYPQPHLSHLH